MVSQVVELQNTRWAEVRAMSGEELETLIENMSACQRLPRSAYHFQRHGKDCGVETQADYEALFLEQVVRTDLRWFTALRPKDKARMWYRIDVDSSFVLQYNETRGRYWTFYRTAGDDIVKQMEDARGWWIEVVRVGGGLETKKW